MRLCFANATRKYGNKVRLPKLGEARDEGLMKAFEGVDAESKKVCFGVGCD